MCSHPLALIRHPSTKHPVAPNWEKIYRGYFDGMHVKVTAESRGKLLAWGRSPQSARDLAIRMARKSRELIEERQAVLQAHLG